MDPLTHGLTGAAVARLVPGNNGEKLPFLIGFFSAQLPDLDVLFQTAADPLTGIELHRHFTHSLLFAPAGAALAAGICWLALKKRLTAGKLYLMVLAAWVSAILLDACTSYGTHLLLPFSGELYSWNLISVVDPVVTAGLLLLGGYSLKRAGKRGPALMAIWLGFFLLYGGLQKLRVKAFVADRIEQRAPAANDGYIVKPTIGNQLLWRVTYTAEGVVYTDGVRAGFLKGMQLYEGESAKLRNPQDREFATLSPRKKKDIERFWKLSEGYMIQHPGNPAILGDARYSMLPTSLSPLWGIDISGRDSDPTPYLYFRDSGPEVRGAFIDMLLGRE